MTTDYLAPHDIMRIGIYEAGAKSSLLWRHLAGMFGRSAGYVRAWARDPDKTNYGTGEHSPIHQVERLMEFFAVHNTKAAILIAERIRYRMEQLMNTSPAVKLDLHQVQQRLSQQQTELIRAYQDGDPNAIAKVFAGYQELASAGLDALRSSEVVKRSFVPARARQAGLDALAVIDKRR